MYHFIQIMIHVYTSFHSTADICRRQRLYGLFVDLKSILITACILVTGYSSVSQNVTSQNVTCCPKLLQVFKFQIVTFWDTGL